MPAPAYGIFEGGGAKGLAHIAGLAAAEKNDLEFVGVAGASAGALIAALVAVGYNSKDLFDPDNPGANLLSRHGINPLSLIGEAEWARFKKAQTVFDGVISGARAAWPAWRVAREIRHTGGYFKTDLIREKLNYFLRIKVTKHHADNGRTIHVPDRITFKDIDPSLVPECCSLKIIVTDVTNRRPVIFGTSPTHRDVEVAEVVAASISIPGVFKPARIASYAAAPDTLYADGGLVSNLPIWVFAEDKLNFERTSLPKGRVPVLAFTLKAENGEAPRIAAASTKLNSALTYAKAVGLTAIFGGQSVVFNFIPDLIQIAMPINLQTTQFDFSQEQALDAYLEAYAAAGRFLGQEIRVKPAKISAVLHAFHQNVVAEISRHLPNAAVQHLRVGLIKPYGETSFRIMHSYNMQDDADDRLIFSNETQGAPEAYFEKAPTFIDFGAAIAAGANANMTKYEFAMVRKSLMSAICLPVFESAQPWAQPQTALRPQPLGVVSIDSDQNLAHVFNHSALMQSLAIMSLNFSDVLK